MAILMVRDLSLAYEAETVVEKLNFEVGRGDNLVIVGENGSGKSTLLRALMGLKTPNRGEIILGEGITRRQIGYLPQQSAHMQDFPASVREVALSGLLSGSKGWFYRRQDVEKMRAMLERLGIADLETRSFRALSGGQRQRVLLARALLGAAQLLLLDEPTTGLDPRSCADLYETLHALNRDGLTLISVSHDLHGALTGATHVLHLHAHGESCFGTVEHFLKGGRLE